MNRTGPLCAAAVLLLAVATPAAAAPEPPAQWKTRTHAALAVTPTFGNGVFRVSVQQAQGLGVGSFTVRTGPDHPAGAGRDLLFGGGVPGTSFMTVRDLTTGADYVQGQYLTTSTEIALDDLGPYTEAIGTTGFHTNWYTVLGSGLMEIDQYVTVHGSTVADSSVEVTTTITGTSTDTFQVQYLWDTAAGTDDGPVLQTGAYNPFGATATREVTLSGVDSVALADNDGGPSLSYGLTGTGPARITPPPTPPQSIQFVCWPRAVGAAPGRYRTDPAIDVATTGAGCPGSAGPDSAVQYLFAAAPIGTSGVRASASLFSTAPDPTSVTVAPARLGSPAVSATLTDTRYGRGVPGRTLTFGAGGRTLCTGVTNANGVAACGGLTEGLAALLGYSAAYAGDGIWAASAGKR
ncbi:hypothetical protein [Amycolatopsis australiensis]|uniref:Ig-like domain (Group 3) n=1 Tax=Amycolatopsis australiensis TaxID=546364 RepID=A0A1K1T7C8_9PSEU|nr:hypothetical protein [Amycolatopsis australiensis]SFW92255.1 hypothetical protein SAMN04489730_8498 [Amycolatopsis australiensis]